MRLYIIRHIAICTTVESTGLPVRGNKRKAEQMLREKLREEETSKPVICSDMQMSACVRRWLSDVKRRVDAVTYQSYDLIAQKHILPYFDENGLRLYQCDVKTLQAFFDEKYANGRLDGKGGLSAASLRQLKNILYQSLTIAVKDGLISANPCQFVELPRKEHFEASYYSAEQLQTLFKALEGDPLLPLVKITALYGLRRSELLGLKWDSIDFESMAPDRYKGSPACQRTNASAHS